MHEQSGKWTVAERGDYPADVSKLRKLLQALSDAKIVEEKTSNPASFAVIGVEDPSLPGATGAEISITAQDGKHAVIIGKPVGEGNFARRSGENTSYSVEPGISFEAEPRYWIDSRLMDIKATDIQSIEIKPAAAVAAYGFTVRSGARTAAAPPAPPPQRHIAPEISLDGVPPGEAADPTARALAHHLERADRRRCDDGRRHRFQQANRRDRHAVRWQRDHPDRRGHRRQALDSIADRQGRRPQCESRGPRV